MVEVRFSEEKMQTIDEDRGYLQAVLPELPDFLLSKDLYWPAGPRRTGPSRAQFAQLSLGNVRLAEIRLRTASQAAQDIALAASVDQMNERWRSNWSKKAAFEYSSRLRMWKDRLDELIRDPSPAFYRYEVRLRVILMLLQGDVLAGIPIQDLEYLSGLDARLRGASVTADFIWEPALQPGFPDIDYWYLYRALISPKGGPNG